MFRKVILSAMMVGGVISFSSEVLAAHVGGYNYSSSTYTSIYADITTPNYPYVYAGSASSAWPMFVENSSSGKYVQVGWYKANQQGNVPDGVHYFSEINYGYDPLTAKWDVHTTWSPVGPQANTIHGYRITTDSSYYYCYADDALIYSPVKKFNATGYQFYEEINGPTPTNAQFAGQANAHARFANLRVFSNGTTYYSPYLTFTKDTYGMYDVSKYSVGVSSSTIDLWDSRY